MARRKRQKKVKPITKFNKKPTKTKVQLLREVLVPWFGVYSDFCRETSLHGLKHTVEPRHHWLERVVWLVVTVCAFAGAVYCGLNQLSRYTTEPVVVSLQRDYRRWRTTFPAVTACFMERVEQEKAQQAILTHWNVTEESDPGKFMYYQEFIELVADVSFRDNLQNFWRYQSDETVRGIDLLELAMSVHPANELMITTAHFRGQVKWFPVMTEAGMCLTFNSQYAEFQCILPDLKWQHQDLLTCHYHSGQCFVRIDSIDKPVRYFIHSPYEISTAISNPTGEVPPGTEIILDFKAIEIQSSTSLRKLTPEQRRCRYPDEWLSSSIRAYSFALCQMHCRSRMAIMFCGCRPFFHVKGDGELCDAQGMACIGRNVEILINIPKNLAKCSCLPQCAEVNYYSHSKTVVIRNISDSEDNVKESSEDHIGALRINMLPPKFRLHRDVLFTLEDLFASLGGTTALFVGASVLTVVETGFFIVRQFVAALVDWVEAKTLKIQYNP